MIWWSILAKTYALVLGAEHWPWALLLWGISALADIRVTVSGMPSHAGASKRFVFREVLYINLAAVVAVWTATGLCDYAAMRWKEGLPFLSLLAMGMFRLLGLPVAEFQGMLSLTTMCGPLEFAVSLDNLAIWVPAWVFSLSGVYLMAWGGRWRRVCSRWGWIGLSLLGISLLRFGLVTAAFVALCDFVGYESEELPLGPFVRWETLSWTYLPFLLALSPLCFRWLKPGEPSAPLRSPRRGLRPVLAWGAIALLLVACMWPSTGKLKNGKVLINTFHTQWSRTDRAYDREWFGADSGYNYACLKEWLARFYEVEELENRIREEDLSGASVLVIYVPDRRFSLDERRAIETFVRSGGGLLVIGDHTNVFGSTSHLNELCEKFGFAFRDDVLFDLDEDFFQLFDAPRISSPFLHGVSFFKFRGPASIRPTSLFTRSVIELDHAKAVRAIYSVNNFYPPPHDHPRMTTGRFCVSAASHYGSGRVMAFADSTVFSNFEIFYPGKYEYLLNAAHWLNHRDRYLMTFVRRCCLVLALLGVLYGMSRVRFPRQMLLILVAGTAAARLTAIVADTVESESWRFPDPVRPLNALFFLSERKDPVYRLRSFTSDLPYEERYDVFVQWALRTGAFSGFEISDLRGANQLVEHLRMAAQATCAQGVILQNEAQLPLLDRLAQGAPDRRHPLLIMFSGKLSWEAIASGLQSSGLADDAEVIARAERAWPNGEIDFRRGSQRVIVVFSAERFSDQSMGFSEKVFPNESQEALFQKAFSLFDRLFEPEPDLDGLEESQAP